MSDRLPLFRSADPVVVKVGTNVLADPAGTLDRRRIRQLAEQLHRLRCGGRRVALVSSGAIGAGVGTLNLGKRPTDLPHLQACAAVGQTRLMHLYEDALAPLGIPAAQILLTAADFDSRARYLNIRNTLRTLFEYDCLPVINENDTVSVAEIKFGDNDQLAAMVANLIRAPLLVLLTNVDGLYTADPRQDASARRVETVANIDAVAGMASDGTSDLGTGGMRSKLKAARLATAAGGAVVMANGSVDGVLDAIFAGEPVGTLFLPHSGPVPSRKRWLGFTAQPKGELHLDAGAARAVGEQGKSLLPVGVRAVVGTFGKGEVVRLIGPDGTEVGRGLSNYSAEAARGLIGRTTGENRRAEGGLPYDELVHRDNLTATGG